MQLTQPKHFTGTVARPKHPPWKTKKSANAKCLKKWQAVVLFLVSLFSTGICYYTFSSISNVEKNLNLCHLNNSHYLLEDIDNLMNSTALNLVNDVNKQASVWETKFEQTQQTDIQDLKKLFNASAFPLLESCFQYYGQEAVKYFNVSTSSDDTVSIKSSLFRASNVISNCSIIDEIRDIAQKAHLYNLFGDSSVLQDLRELVSVFNEAHKEFQLVDTFLTDDKTRNSLMRPLTNIVTTQIALEVLKKISHPNKLLDRVTQKLLGVVTMFVHSHFYVVTSGIVRTDTKIHHILKQLVTVCLVVVLTTTVMLVLRLLYFQKNVIWTVLTRALSLALVGLYVCVYTVMLVQQIHLTKRPEAHFCGFLENLMRLSLVNIVLSVVINMIS